MVGYKKCCKPFPELKCSKTLRVIPGNLKIHLSTLNEVNENSWICTSCYFRAVKRQKVESEVSPITYSTNSPAVPETSSTGSSDSEECQIKSDIVREKLNSILPDIGITPIYPSKLESRPFNEQQKLINLCSTLPSSSTSSVLGIEPLLIDSEENRRKLFLYTEFMDQLKTKFQQLEKNCDKIQLLSTLPKSLTIQEIQEEFNTTQYMVRTAKNIQNKNGSLSLPAPKAGKRISDELKHSVIEYYNDDDVSRIMPGKNDCLSIDKVKVQKRLMMCSLKECYETYKLKYKDDESKNIGFTKFSLLRPKNCVLPGSSGTHTVCVCTIHQNVKLIIYGTRMETITNGKIARYQDCISSILCPEPTATCYLLQCEMCPGLDNFREYLRNAFSDNDCLDAEFSFNQWVSTDRCNLENYSKPLDDFLDYFIIKLRNLIPHYFISLQQSEFIKSKKLTLESTEVLVSCDFAENYAFIMQNAAQGFHWNNKHATIHPFVIYKSDGEQLQHYSFVIISDCLQHDAVAVYLFIEKLLQFLKTKVPDLSKIYYVTDGAVTHYKNKKNFMNITKHKDDFGVDCEWHFHATAHGKGPCDGVGGTIKRMASRASLTQEYDGHITNADELFKWTKTLKTDMNFEFCSNAEYKLKQKTLGKRLSNLKTIQGTRDFHAFIPLGEGFLKCKKYSNSEDYETYKF